MTIRLEELLDHPHLRLELVAGSSGVSRRVVNWAHASDLPDPWNWLAGGELLMKNGRSLPRSTARQVEFVERLADASVAALVIGTDPMTPRFATQAARRADELRLPVLRVPYSMSFIAISRAVADGAAETQSRRMARAERIYTAVQSRADRPGADDGFLSRLEVELGDHLHLLDPTTLRPVLAAGRVPGEPLLADLRHALSERGPAVPAVLHLPRRGRWRAVVVDVPYDEPTLLVSERADDATFDLPMLHHAAMAAAFGLANASLRADLDAELRAVSLGRLISPSTVGRTAGPGLLADGPGGVNELDLTCSRLLATRPAGGDIHRIQVALRRRDVRHLLLVRDDILWVLTDALDTSLEVLEERLDPGAAIGTSMLVGSAARLPDAAREALFATGTAERRRARSALFGEPGHPHPFLAVRNPDEAAALVHAALGPVLAYDELHGTDLVGSLATFLTYRRSWSRTATALHVHRQTVVYRMGKVAALTGRNLAETADIAELWNAIVARELLGPLGSDGERVLSARANPSGC